MVANENSSYYGGTNSANGCDGKTGKWIGSKGPLAPNEKTGLPPTAEHPEGATALLWTA